MTDQTTTVRSQQRLLTTKELAARWSCSEGWLANMRHEGRGPDCIRLGRLVRYDLAVIEAYESAGTQAQPYAVADYRSGPPA